MKSNELFKDCMPHEALRGAFLETEESICVLETGEKGFEPLTFGFGDHCSTVGTTLLSITHVLKNI